MSVRSPAVAVAAYPLAQLACAFAFGILAGTSVLTNQALSRIAFFQSNLVWVPILGATLISIVALAALLRHKLRLATMLVLVATASLGFAFALVEKSRVPHNQI